MNILFIADIIGKPGREVTASLLPELTKLYEIDICIANGENAAGGLGITQKIVQKIYSLGIDVITTGNHLWDKKEMISYVDTDTRILRPANYPPGVPGYGSGVYPTKNGTPVGIINLLGRVFIKEVDCPFRVALRELERIREETNTIIVDFHAEATSEKIALAWFLDGKVSAVIGTHTHVQTADEQILPNGTAYITDVGMTGPFNSVIGIDKESAIYRFLMQLPSKFEPAREDLRLNAVVITVDTNTGKSQKIQRIQLKMEC